MDRAYKANLNESTERLQAAGKGLSAAEAGLQEMAELQGRGWGHSLRFLQLMAFLLFLFLPELKAQIRVPIIEDGQAQVIPEFEIGRASSREGEKSAVASGAADNRM